MERLLTATGAWLYLLIIAIFVHFSFVSIMANVYTGLFIYQKKRDLFYVASFFF